MTRAREGRRGGARTTRSRVVAGGTGMMGRRHMTTRWEDDTVRRHVGGRGVGAGGGFHPWKEIRKREEWEERVK